MKNITFILVFLGLLLSTQMYAQIPTVLQESAFSTKTGVYKDQRDGKYYAYKKYGEKDWFMQNLNWNDDGKAGGAGPEDLDGGKYGRFYKVNTVSSFCPEGWHSATNKEWTTVVNDISKERNLPLLKAPGSYDLYAVMHYMRGGGLATDGGLWLSGTGTEDIAETSAIQFNILPSGEFNGTGYAQPIGQRTYFIGDNNDVFRNYHVGNDNLGSIGRNALKHHRSGNSHGVVRCVREAQIMRDQVIIADEIEVKVLADGEFNLPARATSGLKMIYTSSDPSVAIVDENGKVTIKGVGETTITMTQEGNAEFNPADQESRILSVYSSKYYVILPSLAGTTMLPQSGRHMVVGNTPFEFSVSVLSGYEGVPLVKLSSGETLTATSVIRDTYNYKLEGLTKNVSVEITGITKTIVAGYPRFGTISDIHAGIEGWETKATKALEGLVAQSPQLDAIFITGDITDGGTLAQYEQVKELVKSKVPATISVYYSMGNDDWKSNPILSGEYFDKTMDQDMNQFIVIRGYPFITISAEGKEKANSYLIKTKAFLEEKLEYAAKEYPGKPIFVIQHIPNEGTVYGSAEWGTSSVRATLEKYPQVVAISGNSHYFLANELSIHQNKFTSINTGSIAFARMEKGFDGGIQPAGSETIIEGCVVSVDAQNGIEVKRLDFLNNKEIKKSWAIAAPHDGNSFVYKERKGGEIPYFEDGSTIEIKNLTDITFTVEIPAAKDDDEVTQYLIEVLDENQKLYETSPVFKLTSDYYLATSRPMATTISKDVAKLVENTVYYVRATAIDAFGQKSLPLLQKVTTKAKDINNLSMFDIIADRIRVDNQSTVSTTGLDGNVTSALTHYDDQGLFKDLVYKGQSNDIWGKDTGPATHLKRMKEMAMAYVRESSQYYKNEDLYNKIVKLADYWFAARPTAANWWHGTIGNPKMIGVFLLEMRNGEKKLPVATESKLLYRMATEPGREAEEPVNEGANRSDIALHYLYRACLTGDDALMKRGFVNGFEPIKLVMSGEGIQVDGSYLMHGPQFQLTSYGQELMNTSVSFGMYAANTDYAMPVDKLEILSNFARNSYFKAFRAHYIHHNSTGRGVSRQNSLNRAGNKRYVDALIVMDPQHKDEYELILKRLKAEEEASYGIKPINKTFYLGDYVIHERPEFSFAVRTVSQRTYRSEWGNGEALQTYFLSDGSTSLMQKGNEYYNIPVGWNWTRLPGTTAPQYPFEEIPQWTSTSNKPGTTTFVGGASDDLYSVNTYYFNDTFKDDTSTPKSKDPINTQGYKSWFFFDDAVVALGAGVTSTNVHPINTTVEQNLLKSDVIVSTTSGEATIAQASRGEKVYEDNLKWALHNGAGYFFPKGGKIHTENVTTTRAWSAINNGYSPDPVNTEVFSLWFDHGLSPVDATYAYIVVPNKKTAAEMNSYDVGNLEILSNTPAIQAVKDKKANILQIIFTKAGVFEYDGMSVETDEGAAIILKKLGTPEVTMHIADPGQNRSSITIKTLIPAVSPNKKQTICDFSATGRFAGATKVYTIDTNSENATETIPEREPTIVYRSVTVADTYVTDISSDKDKNFGTSDKLEIKLNNINGYHRQSYAMFSLDDLDKFTDPAKYDVGVSLEFFVTSANTDIKSTNWVISPVEDITWSESEMTWNNKPIIGAETITSVKAFPPKTGAELSDLENRVNFNITEYALTEFAKGNRTIALNINNDLAGDKVNSTFASKEHEDAKIHPMIAIKLYEKAVVLKPQTITFEAIPNKIIGDADFSPLATASSNLPIIYTSSEPTVATIVDGKIHIVGAGKTIITASQAGNEEFAEAEAVTQALTVALKSQTITFEAIPNKTVGDADFSPLATASSNLPIIYTSSEPTVATIVDGKIHIVGAGKTIITASQAGNEEFAEAEAVTQALTVALKSQTITFEAIPNKIVGDADFGLEATASSNLPVTYTSSNLAVATIVDDKIHIVGVGETTITASQVGDKEYAAAEAKTQTLVVYSPEVKIESITINGFELEDITQTYVVPQTDGAKKTIELSIELAGNNQLEGDNPIIVNVEKASIQDVKFIVKNGDKTKEFILKVEKRFDFDKITQHKWGNTFIVNNNNGKNGGHKFTSYKWFKNNGTATVGTKQYYREAEKGKVTLKVEMTTENGTVLQTWPSEVTSNTLSLRAYPNPVISGQVLNLDASEMPAEFLNDASLKIYSMDGMDIQAMKVTQKMTSIKMPTSPGVYLVRVTSEMYVETFKIIVK